MTNADDNNAPQDADLDEVPDEVTPSVEAPEPAGKVNQFGEPRVIDHDGAFWVLSKPSGYTVHPTGVPGDLDMVTWFKARHGDFDHAAPANRLDRATSGVILLSTDEGLTAKLGRYFKEGLIKKEYRALVFKHPRKRGVIRRKLKDQRQGKPVEATTRYWKLEELPGCSLLKVVPETGRRHQIRRHLQGLSHAIVGDERYKPRKFRPIPGFPGRLWLHLQTLEMPDGKTYSAGLSAELKAHLKLLRTPRDSE